jgi:hypothetical protein
VLQNKRENSFWREIIIPCNLNDVLNNLKKDELDLIKKNLEFKNLSSLKKQELALVLSKLIAISHTTMMIVSHHFPMKKKNGYQPLNLLEKAYSSSSAKKKLNSGRKISATDMMN